MSLNIVDTIRIPDSRGSIFDHGAFDPSTRRVFVAHTSCNRLEVVDHDTRRHIATLPDFPEAAGVVADAGEVLVTNRGAASLSLVDASTLQTRAVFDTGARPNGVAIDSRQELAVVACIGDKTRGPELDVLTLDGSKRWSIDLPGRPRWCVTDAVGKRIFLAIREPSIILTAQLPELDGVRHWMLPSDGAHGLDIDHQRHLLYVACDGGALVQCDARRGEVLRQWPLAGVPDATFFNPASDLVHVAIGEPGLVHTVDSRTGASAEFPTARGAKTTALAAPDRLYVFSPDHDGALVLSDAEDYGDEGPRIFL